MVGLLQPLSREFVIVGEDGRPTDYFIRWAQQRQQDIGKAVTNEEVLAKIQEWAAARQITAGAVLSGGGNLSADITIDHEAAFVVPGTYGSSTKSAVITVDEYGHVQDVTEADISGGGGGGGSNPFSPGVPPLASQTILQNNGNYTLTEYSGNRGHTYRSTAAANYVAEVQTLTAPYKLACYVDNNDVLVNLRWGVAIFHPTTTQNIWVNWNTSAQTLFIQAWSAIGGSASTITSFSMGSRQQGWWQAIGDDGTDVYIEISENGVDWKRLWSQVKTGGPMANNYARAGVQYLSDVVGACGTLRTFDPNGLTRELPPV